MNAPLASWKHFWNQLGPSQRTSIVLSSLFVVACMIGLFVWAQQPDMRLLYGSVSPKDAAAIVEDLESKGIPYELRSGGSAIYIPAEQVYKARMDVAAQGLVKGDSVGFEIFDKSSFGISDFVQRTNYIRAVQGELARTIAQLDGVNHARVMVVVPDNRLLLVNRDVKTTASVMVDVGGSSLNPNAVRSIQALVANAVEGLTTQNVAVVDNNGNVLSKEEDENSLPAAGSGIVEYRRNLEKYFADKVETMLERVVGAGNAVVRVSAEIDSAQISRMEEDFDENSPVLRRQTTREETSSTVKGEESIASMNVETNEDSQNIVSNTRTAEESRDRNQDYEIDRTVTNTVENPGRVRRLTASVFIAAQTTLPQDGIEPVVQNRTPEQIDDLREMVANALGIPLDDPEAGSVALQETVFSTSSQYAALLDEPAGFDYMQLLQFGEEIIGGLIALGLFLVFLNLLKRSNQDSTIIDQMEQSRRAASAAANRPSLDMVTPELLNDLIREKPDNAGSTLRNWLSGKPGE